MPMPAPTHRHIAWCLRASATISPRQCTLQATHSASRRQDRKTILVQHLGQLSSSAKAQLQCRRRRRCPRRLTPKSASIRSASSAFDLNKMFSGFKSAPDQPSSSSRVPSVTPRSASSLGPIPGPGKGYSNAGYERSRPHLCARSLGRVGT
jgi:hypothetical protein